MTFAHWADAEGRHCQIGRLRGNSPGKHGPHDWRWGYPASRDGILPTVAEAVAIGRLIALAQRDVFDPPPESIYNVDTWIARLSECDTVREVMATTQLLDHHWEVRRLEAERARR